MSKKSVSKGLFQRYVTSAYFAKRVEDETGIGMSWADFDSDGELEEVWDQLSEKEQARLEKAIGRAVSDTQIQNCIEEMEALIDSEEEDDDLERMEELQNDLTDFVSGYWD